ncbi:MAG: Gmad2 immunoglobulin-like domain-containing protein [bacterium]|nr:Gmad2 immunoglobulin-like domain-containing protein [bacterium]
MKRIYFLVAVLIAAIAALIFWFTPKSLIEVYSPKNDSIITSPVTISGQARGFWYFEASFPARLLDGNGKEIAIIPVQALDEWMTERFVPFSTKMEFIAPKTDTGTLILQKDNPSGLPEHDAEIRIPVRFR